MKKITKIILTFVCCLVVLFLLLPFLVPSKAGMGKQANDSENAEVADPQIFTSNPLAKLVQRLARVFKKGKSAPTSPSAEKPLSQAQVKARFGAAIDEDDYTTAAAAATNEEDDDLLADDSPKNAALAADEEELEWVLVPQMSPEGGVSGMHEINTKDNAFERYAKQERNARFTPTATQTAVPDSKLARLFRPIKQFFGFGEEAAPSAALADATASAGIGHAAKTGSSESFGRNRDSASELAKFKNPTMQNPRFPTSNSANGTYANPTAALLSMVNPESTLEDLARMVADSKYPDPKDEKQKQKRDEMEQDKIEQYKKMFSDSLKEHLVRAAEGQADGGDKIEDTLGCSGSFLKEPCSENPVHSQIDALRAQNQQRFLEATQLALPDAPVTVVLSKADPQGLLERWVNSEASLMDDELLNKSTDDPDELRLKKYRTMVETIAPNCSDANPCYWVAGNVTKQADAKAENLDDTVKASGVSLKGYTSKTLQQLDQQFVATQLALLPPDATAEEKQKRKEAAENTQVPYVLVELRDLQAIQKANDDLLRQSQSKGKQKGKQSATAIISKGQALYTGSAQTALALINDLGNPYIFYGNNNKALDASVSADTAARSEQLTGDFIDATNFVKEIVHDISKQAGKESVLNYMKPAVERAQQDIARQQKEFEQTGKTPVISIPQ